LKSGVGVGAFTAAPARKSAPPLPTRSPFALMPLASALPPVKPVVVPNEAPGNTTAPGMALARLVLMPVVPFTPVVVPSAATPVPVIEVASPVTPRPAVEAPAVPAEVCPAETPSAVPGCAKLPVVPTTLLLPEVLNAGPAVSELARVDPEVPVVLVAELGARTFSRAIVSVGALENVVELVRADVVPVVLVVAVLPFVPTAEPVRVRSWPTAVVEASATATAAARNAGESLRMGEASFRSLLRSIETPRAGCPRL
jgi:hypothetical protein